MQSKTSTPFLTTLPRTIPLLLPATSVNSKNSVFYAEFPFIGQAEPDIAQRLNLPREHVRSFLYRNHHCYYVVTDDEMRVFGFIDVRRDLDTALEERLGS
jgi:hypothetical protein